MKKKIDYSRATHRQPIKIEDMDIPFYLDKDIRIPILTKAKELKIDPKVLVNTLLRNGIQSLEEFERIIR